MIMLLTKNQLTAQIEEFAQGKLTLSALRDWFKPYLVANDLNVPDGNEALVYQLMFAFEDDSVAEQKHRVNARRLVRAVGQLAEPAAVLAVFRLLQQQDRLGNIFEKHFAGIVSRVGLLNAISSSGLTQELRQWLSTASTDQLRSLHSALSNENYLDVLALTQLKER